MNILSRVLVFSICMMALVACNNKNENEANIEQEETANDFQDTTPVTVDDTTKFKFDFAIANIPSPASSVQEFGQLGAPYDNSILNNSKNAQKYTTEFKRSINLGIYNIDMAYAMVNNNGPDVLRHMKNILVLSDALGLKNAVNAMIGKRAETNLSNKDSLFAILDEIYMKSDSYLRTNERVYTAGIIFSGSWLESLYLNCRVAGMAANDKLKNKARENLWNQRLYLGNLIALLEDHKAKKECNDLITELKPIHQEITAIKQPGDINDEKFESISKKIYALRDKMIE